MDTLFLVSSLVDNAAAGIIYWIGLNDRAQEGVYVWNDEQYPVFTPCN